MAKRIPYKIEDQAHLKEAYPELFTTETKTVTVTTIDKEALYQIVKLQHRLGRAVPGVALKDKVGEPASTASSKGQDHDA